jgi:hypothetical protein
MLGKVRLETFEPYNLIKRSKNLFRRTNHTFYSPRFICLSAQLILPLFEFDALSFRVPKTIG